MSSRWIPSADVAVRQWHVGPLVDLVAYAFSWLWLLIPLAMLGDTRDDYLGIFVVVLVLTDLHRHFGLPYVYLDSDVRQRHRVRFYVLPAIMLALWFCSPYFSRHGPALSVVGILGALALVVVLVQFLRRDRDETLPPWHALGRAGLPALAVSAAAMVLDLGIDRGWIWLGAAAAASSMLETAWPREGGGRKGASVVLLALAVAMVAISGGATPTVRPRDLIAALAVFAGAWNIWHVLMQKYGILRLYSAKSGRPTKVPGWVDRLLLFGWTPLFVVWVGPANRDAVLGAYARGSKTLVPILDAMAAAQPYLLAPSIALVVAALAIFLGYERRANGLTNAPRLWLAGGTTLLSIAFFFMNPLKVYLAYGFSHAVEYMVFVWAFQRRRYAAPLSHDPTLARVLQRPWLAYGGFIIAGAVLIVVLQFYGHKVFPEQPKPYFLGIATAEWFMYWGLYQSMLHFYFDGFMWKMRRSTTRAHI